MLQLTEHDRSCLEGGRGPGSQMAMRIIVRMAEVFDAGELIDITAAHIDSTISRGMPRWSMPNDWPIWALRLSCPRRPTSAASMNTAGASGRCRRIGLKGAAADGRVPAHGRQRQLHLRTLPN